MRSTYVESLYDDFLQDPGSVPGSFRAYFEQLAVMSHASTAPVFSEQIESGYNEKQAKVLALIEDYRAKSHLQAQINPLSHPVVDALSARTLESYGLSLRDLPTFFEAGTLAGAKQRSLEQILADLKRLYGGAIAYEYQHISDIAERDWVQAYLESMHEDLTFSPEIKKHLLQRLVQAEGLEKYIGAQYPGATRFSLEGNDSLIVALDTLIQSSTAMGTQEIIMCMSHRGRLNVLVNLLGKRHRQLFDEFEGKHEKSLEAGDVKYHQGFSSNIITPHGQVHVSLAFNPSHLEIVGPVLCGSVKARQQRRIDNDYQQVLPIAIHGDAAICGQGVVMENFHMSQTHGFKVGGTIHIIVNNQIGFTTSDPEDARSTRYCSDIGKMFELPIIHVNANDPEAVYRAMLFALQYRLQYHKDSIIDLIGYRRHGHNEADEPLVTQPLLYQQIRKMPTALGVYADRLIAEKLLTPNELGNLQKQYQSFLDDKNNPLLDHWVADPNRAFASDWTPYTTKDWRTHIDTGVHLPLLGNLALQQLVLPEGFSLHPIVQKTLEHRRAMATGKTPCDWGFVENLAYASLLAEKTIVRLSGQDVCRGTFFHRHAVLYDQNNGQSYTPLAHISDDPTAFSVLNSLLSEEAVLAFEYGFSRTEPKSLVIWEAQYGDFANGAQVVIDQFISAAEQKWGIQSGLTLFLPHGYEGQGAEHSSARIERYLQLCAKQNMQVCIPTTPAQMFHLLRRQVLRPLRKPLIIMTPKNMLRHKWAVSTLEDLAFGSFKPILEETDTLSEKTLKKIILCSGKIYYELLEKRRLEKREDVVILRIEQLYPFPDQELRVELLPYAKVSSVVWCQEEPKNQGAWYSLENRLKACLLEHQRLVVISRPIAAAPAPGYLYLYRDQQAILLEEAFR
ncbi:MAG: 2-oxoglutarate dehydrogenase E1 component [Gammaproteobacteria bacterium]|nr:2-oxoglutarate dehydrogenase E1 component [Gammaproteobacteria bacterium]MBP9728763.1 2-oxoglutarate dehydrogenase E1 component [Gammaproteobacteria bacterium]